jgi:hypothetical protein
MYRYHKKKSSLYTTVSNHLDVDPNPINLSYLWGFRSITGLALITQISEGLFFFWYSKGITLIFDRIPFYPFFCINIFRSLIPDIKGSANNHKHKRANPHKIILTILIVIYLIIFREDSIVECESSGGQVLQQIVQKGVEVFPWGAVAAVATAVVVGATAPFLVSWFVGPAILPPATPVIVKAPTESRVGYIEYWRKKLINDRHGNFNGSPSDPGDISDGDLMLIWLCFILFSLAIIFYFIYHASPYIVEVIKWIWGTVRYLVVKGILQPFSYAFGAESYLWNILSILWDIISNLVQLIFVLSLMMASFNWILSPLFFYIFGGR